MAPGKLFCLWGVLRLSCVHGRGIAMMRTCQLVSAIVCVVICLGGCLPDGLPAYVNNGKTIVAVAWVGGNQQVLWTYDAEKKKATSQPAPVYPAWMIGDHVWVKQAGTYKRYDPAANEFIPAPKALEELQWWKDEVFEKSIQGSFEGKKCLFAGGDAREEKSMWDVLSYPELKKLKSVELESPMSAGRFWWLQVRVDEKHVRHVDLFSPESKKTCSIDTYLDQPVYVRVSDDGKALLLATGSRWYEFAVYDTATGKFLWGWDGSSSSFKGTPLLKKTEVWTVEYEMNAPATASTPASSSRPARPRQPTPKPAILLVHYTPSAGKADWAPAKREVILEYPTSIDAYEDQYTPSPDGSHFVMTVNGKPPRLLFIPIKEGVTAKDVRVVELK